MDEQAFSVTPANTLEPRVAEILKDYEKWRSARRPLEGPWYLNGAFLRGQQHVAYDDAMARLVSPVTPSYRIRLNINRIRPKIKARLAKFFKNRPKPVVMAASSERKDLLNARATQKVLEYQWFKQHLEEKYKDARLWATIASKGYWWFRWDEKQFGRMRVPQTDPVTGQPVMGANGQPQEIDQVAQLGDVSVEVGSPFEVLVADPSISRIGQQPKIIRARYINLADAKARYGAKLQDGKAETGQKLSNYKDLLSTLYPRGESMGSGIATPSHDDQVVEIEHFTAPTDQYPKGRYAVVVGAEQMVDKDELPYEMADMSENPFPCVEFSDTVAPGQYYGPTQIEQMIDLQREYNFLRELLSENIRMMARPKVLVYKQHNLQDGAWTNACVDPETEVLSQRGWVNHTSLTVGEQILAYDPATQRSEWSALQHLHVYDYSGDLISLQGQSVDALVTPNHKWILERADKGTPFRQQVVDTETLLETNGRWNIPLGRAVKYPAGPALSLDFLELLGWIIGDGCLHKMQGSISIAQKKPRGLKRLRELIAILGINATERKGTRGVSQFYVPMEASLEFRAFIDEKKLPSYELIASLNEAQLRALLEGLIASDGHIGLKDGVIKFFNCNYELCERVQAIGTLLGERTSIHVGRPEEKKWFKKDYGEQFYDCKPQYIVFLGTTKQGNRVKRYAGVESLKTSREAYDGTVWCPQVATGFCYYRRNSRVYVSGNSGEILELNWIPGLPPPQILQPANVAADVWNLLALVSREFDDLTQIYPSSEGKAGDASSGFQTNLLQESADSVHAPDIREDELSIEMAARKIRRLMKLGYQAPRLINILGPNSAPDVFEFCENQIDEYAEVRIQVGSMLPDLKSARGQMAMNMYEKGVLGNPQDPMVRKRTLELIDMGGMEVVQEDERRDEDQANQENMRLAQGQGVEHAQFFEDHMMHLMVHQNDYKAPETQQLTPQVKLAKIAHIITHYDWTNPQMGMALRRQYQLGNLPLATPPPLPPPPMGPSGPQPPQLGPGPAGPGAQPPAAPSPHPPAANVPGQTLHLHVKHDAAAPQAPNSGPPGQQSPSPLQ